MRSATLDGVHILFTSVIPLEMRPETHDMWKTATAFGAQCYKELSPRITHVVTNQVRVFALQSCKIHAHLSRRLARRRSRQRAGTPTSRSSG